jgi:hypothetical protein
MQHIIPRGILLIVMVIVVSSLCIFCDVSRADDPLIRQQKTIVVDGVEEVWQLRWEKPPEPICAADDAESSLTCPCTGFAYGEQGNLTLIRDRPGSPSESLVLGPFFVDPGFGGHSPGASVVQRWQPVYDGDDSDWKHANDKDFAAEVRKRKPTDLMLFADYDHDGRATTFLLQVAAKPCGKRQMILVGISKTDPHLHVFSTSEKPHSPLVLASWEWDALLKSNGHTSIIDWNCGDHGSDNEWRAILDAHDGVLHAKFQSFECRAGGPAVKMLEEAVR